MALYEHVFAARQDISPQQVETLTGELKEIVEQNGGTVGKVESWGLKNLSFRIKKNRKAHFVLINIDAPSAAIQELERQERLNEDIIRILTIKVSALDDSPSAMMQKGGRDDRDRSRRDGPPRDRPRSEERSAPAATSTAEATPTPAASEGDAA